MTRDTEIRCRAWPAFSALVALSLAGCAGMGSGGEAREIFNPAAAKASPVSVRSALSKDRCNMQHLGADIAAGMMGFPTRGANVSFANWIEATDTLPAFCRVTGEIAPMDAKAPPIAFGVALPTSWNHRSIQLGGGGLNGKVPTLTAAVGGSQSSALAQGYVTFGSDSGHAIADDRGWALNEESVKNLAYMQLKKTYDVAMVLMKRAYQRQPDFRYFVGRSQGGREGLTVVKRFPADYDGVIADVPIVNFSTLTLSPVLNQIQQIRVSRHVPKAKSTAIINEFMRQCDGLDGLVDGVIGNYIACRAIFDVSQGGSGRDPWAAIRCPGDVDPNPGDTSGKACLTSGQIETVNFMLKPYAYATPLVNGVTHFGNYTPGPLFANLLTDKRYAGQEGGAPTAVYDEGTGLSMVVGALMQDLSSNPITRYVEGGDLDVRRRELSAWMDTSDTDFDAFYRRGGKLIIKFGADDFIAKAGSQIDFFDRLSKDMGPDRLDAFARIYGIPQGGHGMHADAKNWSVDGLGKPLPVEAVPSASDQLAMLTEWVEKQVTPPKFLVATSGKRSLPICSFPAYPRYTSGDPAAAKSYICTRP